MRLPALGQRRQRRAPANPAARRNRLLACLSGLLAWAAFPPLGFVPIIFVAWVPLLRALFGSPRGGSPGVRVAFGLGFLAGLVFYVFVLHWLLFLANDEVTIPGIMLPALFVLASYLALFVGGAAALTSWVAARGRLPGELLLPVVWGLFDWLRATGELAFPWGSLGYCLAPFPAGLQLSALCGYSVLPFWILLGNGLLALALRARREHRPATCLRSLVFGLIVLVGPWIYGAVVLSNAPLETGSGIKITLLQPNTPREIKWKVGYRRLVVEDLLRKTEVAVLREHPDLVIWPETAAPVRIPWEKELYPELSAAIQKTETWTLVGSLDARALPNNAYEDFNAALLFDPEGKERQQYYKRHLVPFGEVTPFRKTAPWLSKLDFGQSEFTPGRDATIFDGPSGLRFRCLICFESIFPDLAREGVRDGAGLLVNITNDFWFGKSAGPLQHAHMAVLRAVENRTPLARCANSGVSFFVDPYGRVREETQLFEEASPTARIAPRPGGSFATRHGDWWQRGLFLLFGLLALLRILRGAIFGPRSLAS